MEKQKEVNFEKNGNSVVLVINGSRMKSSSIVLEEESIYFLNDFKTEKEEVRSKIKAVLEKFNLVFQDITTTSSFSGKHALSSSPIHILVESTREKLQLLLKATRLSNSEFYSSTFTDEMLKFSTEVSFKILGLEK